MPKRSGETLIEYRDRVLNPISPSMCAAKWYNATIWLGSGLTASCHLPPAHKIDIRDIQNNPSGIHNTRHKKEQRNQMLNGGRPSECEYCWKMEDVGPDVVSDRIFKSIIYEDDDVAALEALPWDADVNLKTLEIAFDRVCNFACSYCSAAFSTTWLKDYTNHGPYEHLYSGQDAAKYQKDGSWDQPYGIKNEGNPYIDAFWKWWPELSKTLQELRVTGGEPLMSKNFWELMQRFREDSGNKKMKFSTNTNLGVSDDLIDRIIEASYSINDFDLYTSNEACGTQAEYIRDGLQYDRWRANLVRISEEANITSLHVMLTLNSLSLFSLTEFLEDMLVLKRELRKPPYLSFNILRFPSFMSAVSLPEFIKKERHAHLLEWYARVMEPEGKFTDYERAGFRRLIDYIDVVKTPYEHAAPIEVQWGDFKSFYTQYDARRGKSFVQTFPRLIGDWFTGLPDVHPVVSGLVELPKPGQRFRK